MGRYSMFTDADLSDQVALALQRLSHNISDDTRAAWSAELASVRAEQRRRADRIIVKHIGRSTWQGTQSEWEKRV